MRYLGSKIKLLDFIRNTINKYGIVGDSFCDLFAGTASVSDYFKGQYKIIANDFMYYSYVFSKAKLHNTGTPAFERFVKEYGNNIVVDPKWFEKYLNNPQLDIKIFGNLDIFSYLYY